SDLIVDAAVAPLMSRADDRVCDGEQLALCAGLLEQIHRPRQLTIGAQLSLLRRGVAEGHPRHAMFQLASEEMLGGTLEARLDRHTALDQATCELRCP